MQGALELMALLEWQIAVLDEQIRQATAPFTPQLEQLQSIPRIQAITARDLIAEIGTKRHRFGSAQRLASWADVSALGSRLGRKQAAMAMTQTILVSISHGLMDGTFYDEARYDRHDAREEEQAKKLAIAALERLGYEVALSSVYETA